MQGEHKSSAESFDLIHSPEPANVNNQPSDGPSLDAQTGFPPTWRGSNASHVSEVVYEIDGTLPGNTLYQAGPSADQPEVMKGFTIQVTIVLSRPDGSKTGWGFSLRTTVDGGHEVYNVAKGFDNK